jgi:single-strand DNA-binding protein
MVDLNHVVLIGRLTRDAELKYTAGGQAVCKFSIAVNRRKKSGDQWEDEANFFDIVVWGRQGEALHQYLVKGKMVAVDGELRQDRWQQDGQNRSKVEIVADLLQLLGGGGGNSSERQNNQNAYQNSNQSKNNSYNNSNNQSYDSGVSYNNSTKNDDFVDDIPF